MTEVVKVYALLRSAHLERLLAEPDQRLVYLKAYGDLDAGLLDAAGQRVRRVTLAGAAREVLAPRGPLLLEVNEPLMLPAWPLLLVLRVAVLLRRVLRRGETRCVAYAIENLSPSVALAARTGWPEAVCHNLARLVCGVLIGGLDGIVFGTPAARDLYAATAPAPFAGLESWLVPPLPAVCRCHDPHVKSPRSVLFLGELSERKGLPVVLRAFDLACARGPARLAVVGNGALLSDATAWAAERAEVRLLPDATRAQVHAELSAAQVVVLMSTTSGTWREQIGLPILEALAHGCTVVASDATGVAAALRSAGHTVLVEGTSAERLAEALEGALDHPIPVDDVLGALPAQDGRARAEALLRGGEG